VNDFHKKFWLIRKKGHRYCLIIGDNLGLRPLHYPTSINPLLSSKFFCFGAKLYDHSTKSLVIIYNRNSVPDFSHVQPSNQSPKQGSTKQKSEKSQLVLVSGPAHHSAALSRMSWTIGWFVFPEEIASRIALISSWDFPFCSNRGDKGVHIPVWTSTEIPEEYTFSPQKGLEAPRKVLVELIYLWPCEILTTRSWLLASRRGSQYLYPLPWLKASSAYLNPEERRNEALWMGVKEGLAFVNGIPCSLTAN